MDIEEVMASIADRLQKSASVRTVFGEPIETHGKTIIPIAVVGYGFGAGTGGSRGDGEDGEAPSAGGGAGVGIRPRGVLEITKEETRYVPIRPFGGALAYAAAAMLVGFGLGWYFGRRRPAE